ncbi:hypothetical protein VOLCADRAFT_99573 [Volvox carteri f. nagariensis]|uniref:DUF2415 domain-containing protein n=1 Tax=Volvox carteri f. nagariensis TaxID=3068 RepID=D8UI31_VOLCA|nr:uncharacterized protein VOLCADRAFT_99573 [Volvox carteri f. nagariensis]EFJ40600.1 hypothetical protein VOLCADRAFT_99573 [Volvox carteri f. nagariensis]|eukprot:XP_002958307.1 hypothetical protein VOLCADRAFT_99573 [Volvox carteri f. nagariensis]
MFNSWLRDLVAAGDTSDELLFVCDSSVLQYNSTSREVTAVLSLDWSPNSMTYAHGILAAGGPNSQLCVKDLREKRVLHRDSLGGSVNNAVHVARMAPGQLVLYACNNDYIVKVFNIGPQSLVPTTSFRTQVPVNYCALSPDGRLLSCVGDSTETVVYAVRESSYTRLYSFREAHDTGSSTAWSPSGTFLASAHQDGTLAVWDVRAPTAVHKRRLATACRNVKFSPGVLDLMAFAEHEDLAHIVDVRQWSQVQHLNAGCGQGRDISGISFTAGGDRLWVGLDDCVMSYDLDSVGRRAFAYGCLC